MDRVHARRLASGNTANSSPTRHGPVTTRRLPSAACACSTSCCPSGARSATCRGMLSAPPVVPRSRGSFLLYASAAGLRDRGPSGAAPSARAGGSRSSTRGRRSSTTAGLVRSFARGRSAGVADSRRRLRCSSRRRFRRRRLSASSRCRVIPSAPGAVATSRRGRSRSSFRWSGPCRCTTCSRDAERFRGSAGSRSTRGEGTFEAASRRARRPRTRSVSSTTSTPREPRSTPAREPAGEPERAASTS